MKKHGWRFLPRSVIHLVDEILFFDDNSVDRTREIAFLLSEEFPNFKLFHVPKKSVGKILFDPQQGFRISSK